MSTTTSIEWTDTTWNPVRGCSMAKGSETGGCLNCYAARMASRNLPGLKSPTTGKLFARILQSGPRWTGEVELIESALLKPLSWRKPQRVFVNSMSDLFHEALPDEAIDRVFAVMALTPHITFQVLTKRPERMLAWSNDDARDKINCTLGYPEFADANGHGSYLTSWPLPNVWLGVSVENQATADARIPLLLQTPAAIRFVSYEPALGPIEFRDIVPQNHTQLSTQRNNIDVLRGGIHHPIHGFIKCDIPTLDQVTVGGESGPRARPFNIAWARNTVQQCRNAGVACFVKQLGAKPIIAACRQNHWEWGGAIGLPESQKRFSALDPLRPSSGMWRIHLEDRKGGSMAEWPEDLRVRQFPEVQS